MTIKYGRLTLRSERYLAEYDNIAWNGPEMSALLDDEWHDMVMHVYFSLDSTVGYLECWLDAVQQTMSNGQTRIHFPTICTAEDTYIYPKMGVYGMDEGIGAGPHHWVESPRIGLSYEAVAPEQTSILSWRPVRHSRPIAVMSSQGAIVVHGAAAGDVSLLSPGGRQVMTVRAEGGQNLRIPSGRFASGVYFLEIAGAGRNARSVSDVTVGAY
jgi:hypothetical protein